MQYVEKIEPQVSRRLHLEIMAIPDMEFSAIEKPVYLVGLHIFFSALILSNRIQCGSKLPYDNLFVKIAP